jgi:O-antigen ligase
MAADFLFGISEIFVGSLGRDMTLTARTDIWDASLAAHASRLLGAGYWSFWSQYGKAISSQLNFFFELKEAHNGYIETYLNVGLVGLGLLIVALVTGLGRVLRQVKTSHYGAIRLVFIIVALMYNISESAFAGLNIIWFTLLLALAEYPHRRRRVSRTAAAARLKKVTNAAGGNRPLPEPAVHLTSAGYGYDLFSCS